MFPETFLPNLVLFVLGQAAAWFYLRTGRLWIGGIGTAVLWVAADWAVMAKYVFADEGTHFSNALIVMQITAVVLVVMLAAAQWRRRWSQTARQRSQLFTAGMTAYLHGSQDEAKAVFRRLVRTDPWDAAAWVALGNVCHRQRLPRAAKRCYRRCLRVDLTREYTDLANRLLGRAASAARSVGTADSGGAAAASDTSEAEDAATATPEAEATPSSPDVHKPAAPALPQQPARS